MPAAMAREVVVMFMLVVSFPDIDYPRRYDNAGIVA
jgi:hypothetical protein